ncbi:MAG: hypothetical protein JNL11_17640 [Bdellovibrionaceae bacterium]|nr:hypothetical protein [Pseudobdellovibrionaceae bacterium]
MIKAHYYIHLHPDEGKVKLESLFNEVQETYPAQLKNVAGSYRESFYRISEYRPELLPIFIKARAAEHISNSNVPDNDINRIRSYNYTFRVSPVVLLTTKMYSEIEERTPDFERFKRAMKVILTMPGILVHPDWLNRPKAVLSFTTAPTQFASDFKNYFHAKNIKPFLARVQGTSNLYGRNAVYTAIANSCRIHQIETISILGPLATMSPDARIFLINFSIFQNYFKQRT